MQKRSYTILSSFVRKTFMSAYSFIITLLHSYNWVLKRWTVKVTIPNVRPGSIPYHLILYFKRVSKTVSVNQCITLGSIYRPVYGRLHLGWSRGSCINEFIFFKVSNLYLVNRYTTDMVRWPLNYDSFYNMILSYC